MSVVVDDRFLQLASGLWRDLASGDLVLSTEVMPIADGQSEVDRVTSMVRRAAGDPHQQSAVLSVPVRDESEAIAMTRVIARDVTPLGYVPLRADLDLPDAVRRELSHRHLVLLAVGPAGDASVIRWLRHLSTTSPRRHVTVLFREDGPGAATTPSAQTDVRLLRAERFNRHGRLAGAERWFRAALESARRRRDDQGQVAACRHLVQHLCRRDRWDAAEELARSALRTVDDTACRAEVAALVASILIAQAELDQAEALLSAVAAELVVARRRIAEPFQDAWAQLRFWQGRLEEAVRTSEAPGSITRLMVRGVVAFLRRDAAELVRLAGDASPLDVARGEFCAALFSMLGASLERDAEGVRRFSARLDRQARLVTCARLARLARALSEEAHFMTGLVPPAAHWSCPRTMCGVMPTLDRLFLDWHLAARAGNRDLERQAATRLRRVGVRVIETWRWGCPDMHLIHAIPILLQIVQDAEDDLATLLGACAWLRREAGADAVAFLDSDRTVVAGDGWTATDTADACADRTPDESHVCHATTGGILAFRTVRYAGVVTGVVSVRGREARRETLVEAVSATAALCGPALRARIDLMKTMTASPGLAGEILGSSPSIAALREAVARAAVTPFPVLVEGESGTGKELVARAIHRLSPRRDRRFVPVNCAALTDDLIEAELFGHTRGAFTGAVGSRTGLIEDANGGSLFLDEVSELSPRAQAKLLRVLQEREVRRLGENAARSVDVRVIAATNRPLSDAVRQASFREDLLFRLAVVRLRVPPLRDRIEDVPLLAHACWRSLAAQTGKRAVLGPDAIAHLCRHHWPGNVRELQNTMAALLVIAPERGRVAARHVGHVLSTSLEESQPSPAPLHRARANVERTAVAGALARHGGRRTLAARELGLTRQGLTKAMKRLGLVYGPETGVA